jgi:hypothetical protein
MIPTTAQGVDDPMWGMDTCQAVRSFAMATLFTGATGLPVFFRPSWLTYLLPLWRVNILRTGVDDPMWGMDTCQVVTSFVMAT